MSSAVRQLPRKVKLTRKDREIARLMMAGMNSKTISGALEIAVCTVNRHIAGMCARAKLIDRYELIIWILQNPSCMSAGAETNPGLHLPDCPCGSPGCLGALQLKQA